MRVISEICVPSAYENVFGAMTETERNEAMYRTFLFRHEELLESL
jgi:hypothetical protein